MYAYIWVLSFTILGANPEHKSFDKYETKEACETALAATKQQMKESGKRIAGSCYLTMKTVKQKSK